MDQDKQEFSKRLGFGIRDARIKEGLSQEKLAELCNMHRTYIGMIERGERNMTLYIYLKISYALKISAKDILAYLDSRHGFDPT